MPKIKAHMWILAKNSIWLATYPFYVICYLYANYILNEDIEVKEKTLVALTFKRDFPRTLETFQFNIELDPETSSANPTDI